MNTPEGDLGQRHSGFTITTHQDGLCLTLLGAWQDTSLGALRDTAVRVVRLVESHGWDGHGLEKLLTAQSVARLELQSGREVDVATIEAMKTLRSLSLGGALSRPLRLSQLPQLTELRLEPARDVSFLQETNALQVLALVGVKQRDLGFLQKLSTLRELLLAETKLVSLNGIDSCRGLQRLDLRSSPSLVDVSALAGLQELRAITLRDCPQVTSLAMLSSATDLETIELDNCKRIESLLWISQLPKLRRVALVGSTSIADGSLASLAPMFARLDSFSIPPKPHYDAKFRYDPISGRTTIMEK